MGWVKAIGVLLVICSSIGAAQAQIVVSVQASPGSFNHQAIRKLYPGQALRLRFAGTPLATLADAAQVGSSAFIAVHNSTVPGGLVGASVTALRYYQVDKVLGGVALAIDLCVLQRFDAVRNQTAVTQLLSHPAALKQISAYVAQQNPQPILQAQPLGTAEAAREVAEGRWPMATAAVGPCGLVKQYPELEIVARSVQDDASNTTLFAHLQVSERNVVISEEQARSALQQVEKLAQDFAAIKPIVQ